MKRLTLIILTAMLMFNAQAQDLRQAVVDRHSVRQYQDTPFSEELVGKLEALVREVNAESGLGIRLVTNDPKTMSAAVTYGRFKNAVNYFALIGPADSETLLVDLGYYGEKLVLLCQAMGLNTCWVAGSYRHNEGAVPLAEGEHMAGVISVGYGLNQGNQHKSKDISELADGLEGAPQWYVDGVECAMLGPSAVNRQSFHFAYKDGKVSISGQKESWSKLDVGIAKLHFEIGSGKGPEIWDNGCSCCR